jgi:hypothetical protein
MREYQPFFDPYLHGAVQFHIRNGRHPLSAVKSITPKAKLTAQNRFWRLKCR